MNRTLRRVMIAVVMIVSIVTIASSNDTRQVSIQYSTWGNAQEKAGEEAVVAAFMKAYPNIKVELIHVDGNYEQKLQTMIAGKTIPDVMSIGGAHIADFANAFQPIPDSDIDSSKYIAETLVDGLTYNGQQYALPKRVNTKVFAYNKDLLAKAGVALPGDNFSIEDFRNAAMAVANLGGEGQNKIFGSDPLWFGQWIYQFGGQIVSKDGKQALVNSPEAKKALQFVVDASTTYHFAPNSTEKQGQNMLGWFISGRVGFKADFGPFFLPQMKDVKNFDWDICVPAGKGGEMEIVGVGISKTTKELDAARKLVQFISASKNAQDIYATTGALPVINDSKEVFLNQFPDKNLEEFFNAMSYEVPQPRLKQTAKFADTLYRTLRNRTAVGTGNEDPAKVLDDVVIELNKILAGN